MVIVLVLDMPGDRLPLRKGQITIAPRSGCTPVHMVDDAGIPQPNGVAIFLLCQHLELFLHTYIAHDSS